MLKKISVVLLMMVFCFPASYAQKNLFKGMMKKFSESKEAISKASSEKFKKLFGIELFSNKEAAKKAALEQQRLEQERKAQEEKQRQEQEKLRLEQIRLEQEQQRLKEERAQMEREKQALERVLKQQKKVIKKQPKEIISQENVPPWVSSSRIQFHPKTLLLEANPDQVNEELKKLHQQRKDILALQQQHIDFTYAKVQENLKKGEPINKQQYKIWSQEQEKRNAVALIRRNVPQKEYKTTFVGIGKKPATFVNGAGVVLIGKQEIKKYISTLHYDWLTESPVVDGKVVLDVPFTEGGCRIFDDSDAMLAYAKRIGKANEEKEIALLNKHQELNQKALNSVVSPAVQKALQNKVTEEKFHHLRGNWCRHNAFSLTIDPETNEIFWTSAPPKDKDNILPLMKKHKKKINQMLQKEMAERNQLFAAQQKILEDELQKSKQYNQPIPLFAVSALSFEEVAQKKQQAVDFIRKTVPPEEYATTFKFVIRFHREPLFINGENLVLSGKAEIKKYITVRQIDWLTELPVATGKVLLDVPPANTGYTILE